MWPRRHDGRQDDAADATEGRRARRAGAHTKPVPKPKPKPHHSTGLLPHTGAAKVGTLLVFAFALMLLGIAFRVAPSLWPLVAGRRRRPRGTHRKR